MAFGIQKVNTENYMSDFVGMAKVKMNVIMSYNDVILFMCGKYWNGGGSYCFLLQSLFFLLLN